MGVGLAPALEDLEPAMLFQNVMAPHPVARQAGMYRLRMFFGEFSAGNSGCDVGNGRKNLGGGKRSPGCSGSLAPMGPAQ